MEHVSDENGPQVHEVNAIIEQVETVRVSLVDFTRILDLLAHPPPPNDRLKAAIAALPESL